MGEQPAFRHNKTGEPSDPLKAQLHNAIKVLADLYDLCDAKGSTVDEEAPAFKAAQELLRLHGAHKWPSRSLDPAFSKHLK